MSWSGPHQGQQAHVDRYKFLCPPGVLPFQVKTDIYIYTLYTYKLDLTPPRIPVPNEGLQGFPTKYDDFRLVVTVGGRRSNIQN